MRRTPSIFEKEGDLTMEEVLGSEGVESSIVTPN
jgi:hypothetical protein